MDLDVDYSSTVSVVGNAFDYDGGPLAYSLSGTYDSSSQDLNGQIIWTFENNPARRRDVFAANIASGDSGDVNMDQVEVTGCNALIRFVKSDAIPKKVSKPEITNPDSLILEL